MSFRAADSRDLTIRAWKTRVRNVSQKKTHDIHPPNFEIGNLGSD
jgi:hypothetical protein